MSIVSINPKYGEVEASTIKKIDLGLIGVSEAIRVFKSRHSDLVSKDSQEAVFYAEHHPSIVLGQKQKVIPIQVKKYQRSGCTVIGSSRGGLHTGHEPGQIVIYPVIDLGKRNLGAKRFVSLLLDIVCFSLRDVYGLECTSRLDCAGVWVELEDERQYKIASIGIRIQERVSLYGVSININNNGILQNDIGACDVSGNKYSSVRDIQGKLSPLDIDKFIDVFHQTISKELELLKN